MGVGHFFAELRLVVLGPIKPGNRTAVCSILGLEESRRDAEAQECTKHRGEAAGRQVGLNLDRSDHITESKSASHILKTNM